MESITLAPEPRSVGLARDFVSSILTDRELDTFAAMLLASELASNVVRHAETDFTVTIGFDSSCMRVEVHDGVAATDALRGSSATRPASPPMRSEVEGFHCSKSWRIASGWTTCPAFGTARSCGSNSKQGLADYERSTSGSRVWCSRGRARVDHEGSAPRWERSTGTPAGGLSPLWDSLSGDDAEVMHCPNCGQWVEIPPQEELRFVTREDDAMYLILAARASGTRPRP